MENSKSVSTPADVGTFLVKSNDSKCEISFPYRQACGSLMFAATVSRPDIAYSVGEDCRFMEKPSQLHVRAIKRIFQYLNQTRQLRITYGSDNCNLIGYTDADHARDVETSRSITGYIFMIGNGVVTWKSKRQSHVTLSTTESEYVALCEGTKEAIWIRGLLMELGFEQDSGTKIFCDNQSTIRLVKNPEYHHRTKHINKAMHFTRERDLQGDIMVEYVKSEDQLADVFTKPLSTMKFKSNILRLGLEE